MSLRFKLSIFISLIIFAILLSATALIIVVRSSEIERNLIIRDIITSEKMAPELVNSMRAYYAFQFDSYVSEVNSVLTEDPDIIYIRILSPNGEILFDGSEIQKGKYSDKSIRTVNDKYILDTIYSQTTSQDFIEFNNQRVIRVLAPYTDSYGVYRAMVEFYFSTSQVNKSITQMIIYFSTLFGVFLVLGIILSLIFVHRIMRPVIKLTNAAKEISKGNIDFKIDISSKDEFGELANAFNQMVREIRGYQRGLEDKVSKRTAELEKVNNLMVGRELKMIELKKEINELKEKKGGPASAASDAASGKDKNNE